MNESTIINFWFEELNPAQWFKRNPSLDTQIRQRFLSIHQSAQKCELDHWRRSAQGRLAEILILDQFSRNMFRDSAQAFANDSLALALAQEAVSSGVEEHLPAAQLAFLLMPFMHSESRLIHETAVKLFSRPGLESNLEFELRHKAIIDQFGRYPHRNALLGRESTAEEILFLSQPGSAF